MAANTTFNAPVHRALARMARADAGFPPNASPSLDFLSSGLQDHRLQANSRGSSAVQPSLVGWYGGNDIITANIVPNTASTSNIAALANVVSGTGMTFRASTGSGIVVLSSAAPAQFFPGGNVVSAGVAIDALPTLYMFGASGTATCYTGFYNRSTTVGRAVSISGVAGGAGGNFLVSGYDCYGFPTSQLVTVAAGANTVNTTKTFKVITSVVPQFTDAHNYSVGTADIFGLGLFANYISDLLIYWNSALVTAATGFTAGDTTSPATTTTGDVRGTYAVQSGSDGVKRLVIRQAPVLGLIQANPTTGLFGQPQV